MAFEPESNDFEQLKQGIKLNKFDNVKACQTAVGSKDGEVTLNISNKSNLHSIRSKSKSGNPNIQKVQSKKIDTILDGIEREYELTIIRIDVEGFEDEVFKGMQNFVQGREDSIIITELHSNLTGQNISEMVDMLTTNDFEVDFYTESSGKIGYNEVQGQNSYLIAQRK